MLTLKSISAEREGMREAERQGACMVPGGRRIEWPLSLLSFLVMDDLECPRMPCFGLPYPDALNLILGRPVPCILTLGMALV